MAANKEISRNGERHFRTRERKGPPLGIIHCRHKNDRNMNALTHEVCIKSGLDLVEKNHELHEGNCTKVFSISAGRTKNFFGKVFQNKD